MTIKDWLDQSKLPRLDGELLLCFVLGVDRTYLAAHSESSLNADEHTRLSDLAERRANGEPLAYLTGNREFYGRDFVVLPAVLIPRPETEALVGLVLEFLEQTRPDYASVLDVGTGSGCIAITLALESPSTKVSACDISDDALEIARGNAENLGAKVDFTQSDLLGNVSGQFDCIVANLPYVSRDWKVSPGTAFEPDTALYAEDDGLALIKKLILYAPSHLRPGGQLFLEMDTRQIDNAIKFAAENTGFKVIKTAPFALALQI